MRKGDKYLNISTHFPQKVDEKKRKSRYFFSPPSHIKNLIRKGDRYLFITTTYFPLKFYKKKRQSKHFASLPSNI